jgi:hypothetical protein
VSVLKFFYFCADITCYRAASIGLPHSLRGKKELRANY